MQIDWKALFLDMNGRIGRIQFWIGFGIIIAVSLVLQIVPIIGQLLGLLLIWPQVAVHAKRLHDMGRTAWLMVIPLVVTIACVVAAVMSGGATVLAAMRQDDNQALASAAGGIGLTLLFLLLPILVGFGFLLWVGLSRGDPQPNRFGPPPSI